MRLLLTLVLAVTFSPLVSAQEEGDNLAAYGLESLEITSDAAGEEVRGLSASAGYSSMSMVTGFLFDPATSSTARVTTINQTSSYGDGVSQPVSASGQTVAGMSYAWSVNGVIAQIAGFAQGSGLSLVNLRQ